MDASDSKAADFERRLSRRVSRASRSLSVHGRGSVAEVNVDEDVRPTSEIADPAALARHASVVSSHYSLYNTSTRPSISSIHEIHRPDSFAQAAFSSSALSAPSAPSESSESTSSSTVAPSDASSSPSLPPSAPDTSATQSPPPTHAVPGMVNRPSSISKPPIGIAAIGRGGLGMGGSSDSSSFDSGSGTAANSDSAAGSGQVPLPVSEEPYEGPSGPSFPYQLYPQNVRMERTMSTATASTTARSESTYNGPRGPTFPYSLYPQNPVAVAGGPSTIPMSTIPVGFPGMGDAYRRRIGPDGEEIGDMIGPDGHTEQLPPYSRYPEDSYTRKMQAVAAASGPDHPPLALALAGAGAGAAVSATALDAAAATDTAAATQPGAVPVAVPEAAAVAVPEPAVTTQSAVPALQPIPGAGGLGLAPRNPEFDGADDPDSPQSRHSSRSFTSNASQHEINTAAQAVNEKKHGRSRLQELSRRRLWGIVPYWALCLLVTMLILMGVILGAVIGTFLSKHKKPPTGHKDSATTSAVTVTVDATPIPTPTNLPPLPTGEYGLPLSVNKSPNACFNDTTQSQAWSCNVWYLSGLTVNVVADTMWTYEKPVYNVSIKRNESQSLSHGVFWYGAQSPVINDVSRMQLVNDTLETNRGPAWFKMLMYNKTVVVPESLLSQTSTAASSTQTKASRRSKIWMRRNEIEGLDRGVNPFHRKSVAAAGDKPWVCTWPDTILELFIYPNQNTSAYKISLSSSVVSATATPTSSIAVANAVVNNGVVVQTVPATSLPTSAAPATKASTTPPPTEAATMGTTTSSSLSSTSSADPDMPPPPPPYARVIKVEERRMANSPEATCVQYELKPSGTGLTAVPNLDTNGNKIEIFIAESEPGPSLGVTRRDRYDGASLFERRDVTMSNCGCFWMST